MEAFPDLAGLTDAELDSLIADLERQEDAISMRRRLLHGRIDLLRHEYVTRLRAQVEEGSGPEASGEPHLERPVFEGSGELPDDAGLEPLPDLASISSDELRATIHELEQEEDDVSLQRRFLQGRVDILRAERASRRRTGHGLDVDELARVLAGNPSGGGDGPA